MQIHTSLLALAACAALALPAGASFAQSAKEQAPGQMKKKEGAQSAKEYAPGQRKKQGQQSGGAQTQQPTTSQPQAAPQPAQQKAKGGKRFGEYDTDGSGGLSKAELDKAPQGRHPNIRRNFDAMDTNKDGQVTAAEHDAWRQAKRTGQTAPAPTQPATTAPATQRPTTTATKPAPAQTTAPTTQTPAKSSKEQKKEMRRKPAE